MTDPFSSATTINYDAAGRTQSVTGTYGGVNYNYASNIGYRAWGAVKSVSYNNSSPTTVSYNSRLQPIQYRGNPGRYDYSYYADGRLSSLRDLDDVTGDPHVVTFHYMSRVYSYDQAARTTSVSALNPNPNGNLIPAPFTGTYGHDAFDNMTSRSGH